jgi:catechol 2,3-dioxygenase-like lactoylglutathione lyase family enzyme
MDSQQAARIWSGKSDPILPSAALDRTLQFWAALGFTTETWSDDEGYAWVYPGTSREGIYLDYNLTEDLDPFVSSGMAYLTVPNADEVYRAIREAGVPDAIAEDGLPRLSTRELREQWVAGISLARVTRPIDQAWGKRELALFDPDNNLIRVGSAR